MNVLDIKEDVSHEASEQHDDVDAPSSIQGEANDIESGRETPQDEVIATPSAPVTSSTPTSSPSCGTRVRRILRCLLSVLTGIFTFIYNHFAFLFVMANAILIVLIMMQLIPTTLMWIPVAATGWYLLYKLCTCIVEYCSRPAPPDTSHHDLEDLLNHLAYRTYINNRVNPRFSPDFHGIARPRGYGRQYANSMDRNNFIRNNVRTFRHGWQNVGQLMAVNPRGFLRLFNDRSQYRFSNPRDEEEFMVVVVDVLNRRLQYLNQIAGEMMNILDHENALNVAQGGPPQSNGLPSEAIAQLPTMIYSRARPDEEHKSCSICLEDLEEESTVVALPCQHVFHVECIGRWLTVQNVCPNCKARIQV